MTVMLLFPWTNRLAISLLMVLNLNKKRFFDVLLRLASNQKELKRVV